MSRIYTTVQGDMWDQIARRQLGGTEHTGALMRANPSRLEYYIFPAGIPLVLPEVTQRRAAATALPWKKR